MKLKIIIVLFCVFTTSVMLAQNPGDFGYPTDPNPVDTPEPGDFGEGQDPPPSPINQYVLVLLAGGLLYATYKHFKLQKKNN